MSSTDSIISARNSAPPSATGAKVTPQLPSTTEVTPCQHDELAIGSQASWASRWVWMSTKPGVTTCPSASISRRPGPSTRPTSTILSPSTATSPVHPGAPVPSTTVPPRITRSCAMPSPLPCRSPPTVASGPRSPTSGSAHEPCVVVEDPQDLVTGCRGNP